MSGMLLLALQDSTVWLLTAGFFVCGFHVAFITVHMPAYLDDKGLPAELGAYSLMLIGFFNIVGSFVAGYMGGKFSRKYLLSSLYSLRSVTIAAFIWVPVSTPSGLFFFRRHGFALAEHRVVDVWLSSDHLWDTV